MTTSNDPQGPRRPPTTATTPDDSDDPRRPLDPRRLLDPGRPRRPCRPQNTKNQNTKQHQHSTTTRKPRQHATTSNDRDDPNDLEDPRRPCSRQNDKHTQKLKQQKQAGQRQGNTEEKKSKAGLQKRTGKNLCLILKQGYQVNLFTGPMAKAGVTRPGRKKDFPSPKAARQG